MNPPGSIRTDWMRVFSEIFIKTIDIFGERAKILEDMQKPCGNQAVIPAISERETVRALGPGILQATSCVARDDRDGRSRYRAAKIPLFAVN